ncbi:hypothetical protein GCM10011313_04850 [Mycetocola zhadangensis]|nr:hypothetical protein GCM10011313_04850 [Mycetocola zhadangensis]
MFASEEEALAAATDTYAKYLAISDAVSADGGREPERIRPYVTEAFWLTEAAGIGGLVSAGYRTTGSSSFDQTTMANLEEGAITVQLCLDVSQVRVLDSGGADVTPDDRVDRAPLEVEFEVSVNPVTLSIAKSDVWSNQDSC